MVCRKLLLLQELLLALLRLRLFFRVSLVLPLLESHDLFVLLLPLVVAMVTAAVLLLLVVQGRHVNPRKQVQQTMSDDVLLCLAPASPDDHLTSVYQRTRA